MAQEIIVTIGDDGIPVIETKGFKGKACLKATEGLEKALGIVKDRQHTPEYNQQETVARQQQAGR